jgi:restriction system protein
MIKPVWGIHAGHEGDADSLFLKKDKVALGWQIIGDLSLIKPNREAFKAKVTSVYPDYKPGKIYNNAGQLFRFVHEMKTGDYIVYPSRQERTINIGIIEGDYKYEPNISDKYPHTRTVKWLKKHPRTNFTQGALYEVGSAMAFFQIRNYADEFIVSLEGKQEPKEEKNDPTVGIVAEDIEETTKDFILKQLSTELKGHPFADFVAQLLNVIGYKTRVSPEGPDGGIDIIAHKDDLGFEPPIIKVQVKSTDGSIGDPIVSALYGKVSANEYGLLVTLGTFTNSAKNFAKSKSNLRLIDGVELVDLIMEHYEKFDSKYKGLIPLKKVYVPEIIEEND